jgi:hypothetical protein
VWIDEEKITYTGKSANILTGCTRGGAGTSPTPHKSGADIWEHRAQYDSLLASHELHSVGDVYAEVEGRLLRVTGGVSAVLNGGRHYLRATGQIRIDRSGIESSYTVGDRTVSRRASNIPVQQKYFNATGGFEPITVSFPTAPSGALSDIRTRISWNVKVKETFTGEISIFTGPDNTYPKLCTIKGDGTVHPYLSSTYEDSEGAWVASKSLSYSATSGVGLDKVIFSITGAEEEAVIAPPFGGDSGGGKTTGEALNVPLQHDYFNATGQYEPAVTINFSSAPPGTLTEISTRVSFNIEVVAPPNTDISFHTGPGSSYPKVATVKADGTVLAYLPHMEESRGSWAGSTTVYYACGSSVSPGKVVFTVSDTSQSARTTEENSVMRVDSYSTRAVERFHAVVSGCKDPDGNYGGVGGLVERPDWVIKHFLVGRMGFDPSDIDDVSFAAAGTEYESLGYRFAFAVVDRIKPSEFLKRLAFECRSTLRHIDGRWHLDAVPDIAPPAVKAITKEELAGEYAKFSFSKTPVVDVTNELAARFGRNCSALGSESAWLGTASSSDAASQAKYGTYPGSYDFEAIREQAMAESVLGHILLQRKAPLLAVEFPVFYEHFDLRAGDTIQVENPLYNGRKFYIEEIRRLDRFRATVRAVEWWA